MLHNSWTKQQITACYLAVILNVIGLKKASFHTHTIIKIKKYQVLLLLFKCCISGRKSHACMQFHVILEPFIVYLCTNSWLDSYVAEKLATLDSCSTGIANITSTPMEVEDVGGGEPWSGR